MYHIFPNVKKQTMLDGVSSFSKTLKVYSEEKESLLNELKSEFDIVYKPLAESNFLLLKGEELEDEEYQIKISDNTIIIFANNESGFYYGIKTILQMFKTGLNLQNVYIEDKPDLKVRGFMHDISRNKVPKVETIKYIIDIMSDLKMNHLELYVEGFSFEYKSFEKYLEKESYITTEEYKQIEKYALDHYIDLVPNQNGFGHMSEWLRQDEFKHLAEAPGGIDLWGSHRDPSTLNALDDGSIELLKKMYKDMLSIAQSKYFHMNFDEPFELGMDKTKEEVKKYGKEKVYLDYAIKAYDEIKKYNKTPLIWGDVLVNHPSILSEIPKDMIFVDWGYEAEYPFMKNLSQLKERGIPFMAAPATTTWCSLLTRTYDWYENIKNAVESVYKLNGEGVLLTDWGDIGHLQHLTASLAPLCYCGLLSYRVQEGTFKLLKEYLNNCIFKDSEGLMADVVIDSGTYYKYEPHYTGNGTITFYTMVWILNSFKETDPILYYTNKMKYNYMSLHQYELLEEFFNQKKKELSMCNVDELFVKELMHSINLLSLLAKVNISHNSKIEKSIRTKLLNDALQNVDELIDELKRLWKIRNKQSRLLLSVEIIEKVRTFILLSIKHLGGTNETKN